MNDPPTRMGAACLPRTTGLAASSLSLGRAGSIPREAVRGSPLAAGTSNPAPAAGASGSPGGAEEDGRAGEDVDSLSWVREKVLFLLHPERGLGTYWGSGQEEGAHGEGRSQDCGDDRECPSSHLPREKRISGSRVDAPPRALPQDTAAPPKSVFVRVVDYQVTQEVMCTEWMKGCMTTQTEERSMTAVTFRANKR